MKICILSYLCFVHFFTYKSYHQFFHTRSFNSKPCKRVENLQHNMVHRVDILELTFFISHACLDSIVINFYIMHTFYNGLRSFLVFVQKQIIFTKYIIKFPYILSTCISGKLHRNMYEWSCRIDFSPLRLCAIF